jgi:hypothetical protein
MQTNANAYDCIGWTPSKKVLALNAVGLCTLNQVDP